MAFQDTGVFNKGQWNEIDIGKHRSNYQELKDNFELAKPMLRQVQQVMAPYLGRNLSSDFDQREDEGYRKDQYRLSIRPYLASRALTDLFSEGLTPEDRPMLAFEFEDEFLMANKEVQQWLFYVQNRVLSGFESGGFYDQSKIAYQELPIFGSANLNVSDDWDELAEQFGSNFYTDTIGEFLFGLGRANSVSVTYRRKAMTVGQIRDQFGYENLRKNLQQMVDKGMMNKVWTMVNGIAPSKYFEPEGMGPRGMTYDNFWFPDCQYGTRSSLSQGSVGRGDNDIIKADRTDGKPNITPRWLVRGDETYGISPTIEGLNGVKMLNKMKQLQYKALNKTIDPPSWAPMSLKPLGIRNTAGAQNYYPDYMKPDAVFQNEAINYDIRDTVEEMEKTCAEIDELLYKDVSQAMHQLAQAAPNGTAYMASKVWQEAMTRIGPVVNMLKRSFLKPAIDRQFLIELNNGRIPPPPPIVPRGMPIKIKYTSLLTRSIALIGDLNSVQEALAINGQLAQLDPTAAMLFKPFKTQTLVNNALGLNPELLQSEDEYKQAVANNAKQQQMAAEMQMAQMGADAANKAGLTK